MGACNRKEMGAGCKEGVRRWGGARGPGRRGGLCFTGPRHMAFGFSQVNGVLGKLPVGRVMTLSLKEMLLSRVGTGPDVRSLWLCARERKCL